MNTNNVLDQYGNPSSPEKNQGANKASLTEKARTMKATVYGREREIDKSSADLVWVNYETRLRKMMQELLQPTVKRSREDREMYDSLVKKYDFLHKRVETLEIITNKTDTQQTIFDDIFMKITNLDTERKAQHTEVSERIMKLQDDIKLINYDYGHIQENIKEAKQVSQEISRNFMQTTIQLDEYKKKFGNMITGIQTTIDKNKDEQKENFIKTEERFQGLENMVLEIKTKLQSEELANEATRATVEELIAKVRCFEENVAHNNEQILDFSQHIDSIKSTKSKMQEMDMQVRATENFLEKYLPIFTQSQISETLFHCLPNTNKKKLFFYEEKKFKDLNNDILKDDGNPNLAKKMETMYSLLETTVKRYTRSMAASSLGIKQPDSEPATGKTPSPLQKLSKRRSGGNDDTSSDVNTYIAGDENMSDEILLNDDKSSNYNKRRLYSDNSISNLNAPSNYDGRPEENGTLFSTGEGSKSGEGDNPSSKIKVHDGKFADGAHEMSFEQDKRKHTIEHLKANAHHENGDDSDAGSDLDRMRANQILDIQENISNLKEQHKNSIKKVTDEFNLKLSRLAQDQFEFSENASMGVRNAMIEIENFLKLKQKEELDKVSEIEGLYENLKVNNRSQEKTYRFLKKISETIAPLVETVHRLLAVSLKDESEKSVASSLSQNLTEKSLDNKDILRRKRDSDPKGRMKDLPYLAGTRVSTLPDEKTEPAQDIDVKLKHNDKVVGKVEFLELTLDNFKDCLSFSTKFKRAHNFAHFFEEETEKHVLDYLQKSSKPAKGGAHLLYEDKVNQRSIPTGMKPPFSRLANLGYNNYRGESFQGKVPPLEKRKGSVNVLRERDQSLGNKSFGA